MKILSVFSIILSIPDLGEIYPLGGSADRLGLVDPVTGECLPAAMLPYCGRTFLESHIRDLQADERALLICISICLREAVIGEACTILASLYSGTVCIWNYQSQTMAKSFEVTELREIRDQVYDIKNRKVAIKVLCCNLEKIRDKIC
ncbi:uncharacterized protein LOC141708642 isoform X2 [Apium graveolens]|uniref:uncharacterized protein LOC141708642 isoform X2 n=1 Tax=Apium graveolens TaxID=4045 RepID=UPI003D7BAE59